MNPAGWILILFVHVGPMSDGNSNAITTAQLHSQQTCEAAGKAAKQLTLGTVKKIEYACVKQ